MLEGGKGDFKPNKKVLPYIVLPSHTHGGSDALVIKHSLLSVVWFKYACVCMHTIGIFRMNVIIFIGSIIFAAIDFFYLEDIIGCKVIDKDIIRTG